MTGKSSELQNGSQSSEQQNVSGRWQLAHGLVAGNSRTEALVCHPIIRD